MVVGVGSNGTSSGGEEPNCLGAGWGFTGMSSAAQKIGGGVR